LSEDVVIREGFIEDISNNMVILSYTLIELQQIKNLNQLNNKTSIKKICKKNNNELEYIYESIDDTIKIIKIIYNQSQYKNIEKKPCCKCSEEILLEEKEFAVGVIN
jgi:hypothetical protein